MLDYFESQDRPADGGPVTHRCFHLHRQFVDEHLGCPLADPRSVTSSTDIPDAPCASCTAVARARLELGADALSAQLAAVANDCPETPATVDNPARAALRSELGRLLAQLASYDEQIRVASTRLDADGLGEEARALCSAEIAFLRAARVTPVLVFVTTRRKMHTHRRAVDEHVGCSGVMSDSDEAPPSPHAPCALCADDEARGCVPVPGRSALLCAACAHANDRWTTPTESIAAGFQRGSLRPFGMRVLTPLEEQTMAIRQGDGRRCEECNSNDVGYTSHCQFSDLPEGMLLHLARGVDAIGAPHPKNFRHVALPEVIDMVPYSRVPAAGAPALAAAGGALFYRLIAVVVHEGATTKSGHYYTYRRDMPVAVGAPAVACPAWECWNDTTVTGVTWATVAAAPAFLAVYEVVDAALLRTVFPRAALAAALAVPQAAAAAPAGAAVAQAGMHVVVL